MAGMTIEDLRLNPLARAGAEKLLALHQSVVFTSGRRDRLRQAHAMAAGIVKSGQRDWIQRTYLEGDLLQSWVNFHPEAVTEIEIAQGLDLTMQGMSLLELMRLSAHFSGDAFDIEPMVAGQDGTPTEEGERVIVTIYSLEGMEKFLRKEGKLNRWHCQFIRSAEV